MFVITSARVVITERSYSGEIPMPYPVEGTSPQCDCGDCIDSIE